MSLQASQFIEIVEPVVEYLDAKQPTAKTPRRPNSLEGKTIALLANWKPISLPFLEVMAERLRANLGLNAFALHPDWQFTHPQRVGKIAPEADRIAQQCQLMLSGVAD